MTGIGFFAPLPLAMMMPFMAGQSMIMGDAFGKAYQYGKRKISAMSNEEFNKLTPDDLAKSLQTDYMSIIPSLKASTVASRDFQSFIIKELATIVRSVPTDVIQGVSGASNVSDALTGQGAVGLSPEISKANIEWIQQDIANSQQNFSDVSSAIANFFNSFATIPQAFASSGSSGASFELNPDNTNVGLTLEKNKLQNEITSSEQQEKARFQRTVETAHDNTILAMFGDLSVYPNWQKSLITEQYNKRGLNPAPINKEIEAILQSQVPTALSTYNSNKKIMLQELQDRKKLRDKWAAQMGKGHANEKTIEAQWRRFVKQIEVKQKELQNLITLAMNNTDTRTQANKDRTGKIWLI